MNKVETLRQLATLIGSRDAARCFLSRLFGATIIRVRPPQMEHDVTLRFNNSDVVLFLGIFLHQDCHIRLPWAPASILDLGANTGLTAIAFHQQFPAARIIALEPDRETYALCVRNTSPYPNVECMHGMVGTDSGWGRAVNPEDISMARRFEIDPDAAQGTLPVVTIPDLLTSHALPRPILAKMDVEGAEIGLFHSPATWLPRVDAVLVEPHGVGTADLITQTFEQYGYAVSQCGEKILGTGKLA